jgi:hypothetical protein
MDGTGYQGRRQVKADASHRAIELLYSSASAQSDSADAFAHNRPRAIEIERNLFYIMGSSSIQDMHSDMNSRLHSSLDADLLQSLCH